MNIHKNARTTPHSRAEIARRVIVEGQAPSVVAAAFGICLKTVGKWVTRFKAGGLEALADRCIGGTAIGGLRADGHDGFRSSKRASALRTLTS